MISKYKRTRTNLNDDKVLEMRNKYSKVNSGRKIKGFPITQTAERNPIKTVSYIRRRQKEARKSYTLDFRCPSSIK